MISTSNNRVLITNFKLIEMCIKSSLKGGFPTLRKGPNDTLRVALLLYRLGYLTNESCNF